MIYLNYKVHFFDLSAQIYVLTNQEANCLIKTLVESKLHNLLLVIMARDSTEYSDIRNVLEILVQTSIIIFW